MDNSVRPIEWQNVTARAHNSRSRKELRAIGGQGAIGEWSLQRSAASPGLDAGAHAGFPDDERLHASATVIDTHFQFLCEMER